MAEMNQFVDLFRRAHPLQGAGDDARQVMELPDQFRVPLAFAVQKCQEEAAQYGGADLYRQGQGGFQILFGAIAPVGLRFLR